MKPIVAPVDFSNATPRVIAEAVALARPLQAQLVFLHVTQPAPPVASEFAFIGIDPSVEVVAEQSAIQRLAYLQRQLASQGITASTMHAAGNPGAMIVARARELDASYIILGSHGHGVLYDLIVGSTAKRVVKEAHCPVIVIPTRVRSSYQPGSLAFEPIDATDELPPFTASRVLTPARLTERGPLSLHRIDSAHPRS